MMTAGSIRTYAFTPDGELDGGTISGPVVLDDAGRVLDARGAEAEVHRLATDRQAEHGVAYGAALEEVGREEPELARLYAGAQAARRPDARARAGAELDTVARRLAVRRNISYTAAFQDVIHDPAYGDLVARYAGQPVERVPVATAPQPAAKSAAQLGPAEARGKYGDPLPKITVDELARWVWRLAQAVLDRGEARDIGHARKIVLGDPKNRVLRAVHRRLLPYDDLPEPPAPEDAWA